MTLARVETRHFEFQAFGATRKDARAALVQAFRQHCAEYTDADPRYFRELLRDVQYVSFQLGEAFRDWQTMRPATPVLPKEQSVEWQANANARAKSMTTRKAAK